MASAAVRGVFTPVRNESIRRHAGARSTSSCARRRPGVLRDPARLTRRPTHFSAAADAAAHMRFYYLRYFPPVHRHPAHPRRHRRTPNVRVRRPRQRRSCVTLRFVALRVVLITAYWLQLLYYGPELN